MADTKQGNYLVQAWLVLMLAGGFGAAMAGVHIALNSGIEANKRNETYGQIPKLIKGADKDRVADGSFTVQIGAATVKRKFYKALGSDGKTVIGYMLRASGMGYVDKIEVLIGLDATIENITGIYVLSQIETPGLGSKIRTDEFERQFKMKSATNPEGISVRKTPPPPDSNDIQAIASATISSQSVCGIVNKAVQEFREHFDASIQRKLALENIPRMIPGATRERIEEIPAGDQIVYKVLDVDGQVLAWLAGGRAEGNWNRIDMLVALDPTARTIMKVHVIGQRENRLRWNKVVRAHYIESFAGKQAEPIVIVKARAPLADQQVQAVTAATITSTAICHIVNKTVRRLKASVAEIQSGATVAMKER